jgi:hypothetical protein
MGGYYLMEHREIGLEVSQYIHLALDEDQWRALVNKVMNFRVS